MPEGVRRPGRAGGRPWHQVVAGPVPPPEGAVRDLLESGRLDPARPGLLVAGAGCGQPEAVLALSASLGWPVLADPRSGLRLVRPGVVGTADAILRSDAFARDHPPRTVVRLGEPWVSKVVNGFLSSAIADGAESVVVDPWGGWPDPGRETPTFVRCDPTLFCLALARLVDPGASGGGSAGGPSDGLAGWWRSWEEAESAARSVLGGLATDAAMGGDGGALTEPSLAHRLFAGMPARSTLVVSSSMPVRDLEAFAVPRPDPPRVVANRGANGIDGVVSTALGVALASDGPTVALVGDLAFLHDVSALVRAEALSARLTIVVADNDGGGIFSFLDPAEVLDTTSFDLLFGTPQVPDVADVAAGFGWPVDRCGPATGATAFEDALERRLAGESMSVIRVALPERAENVAVHRRINAAVVAAIGR